MEQIKTTKDIFRENLRHYRLGLQLTQAQLADKANIHRTYISEMESGKCSPSIDVVSRIASALQLEPYQMLRSYSEEIAEK